jgi:hypothetical protein
MSDMASKVAGLETCFEKMETQFTTSFAFFQKEVKDGVSNFIVVGFSLIACGMTLTKTHRATQASSPLQLLRLAAMTQCLPLWIAL